MNFSLSCVDLRFVYGQYVLELHDYKLKFVGHSPNLKFEILKQKLSEAKFACAALFVLDTTSDF